MKKLFVLKLVSLAIISLIAVSPLTACSNKNGSPEVDSTNNSSVASTTTISNKPANLRIMWWGTDVRHQATLNAIKLYMEKNKKVTLEAQYQGFDGYSDKLLMMLSSGTAPDIFMLGTANFGQIDSFNNGQGAVIDLKQNKLIDLELFDKGIINDVATVNGKVIGIPVGLNSDTGVLKNLDFFKKFNIPEDITLDWDSIMDYGKKVHSADKDSYLIAGTGAQSYELIFRMLLMQRTGKLNIAPDYTIGFTKEDVVETLKYMKQLEDNGVIETYKETYSYKDFKENPRYMAGKTGIAFVPASGATGIKLPNVRYGGDRFPIIANAKNSFESISANMFWCINKTTTDSKASADFLTWLVTDKDAILTLSECRGPQPVEESRKILLDAGKSDPVVNQIFLAVQKKTGKSTGFLRQETPFLLEAVNCYSKALLGAATPEKAAEEYFNACSKAAEQGKKTAAAK